MPYVQRMVGVCTHQVLPARWQNFDDVVHLGSQETCCQFLSSFLSRNVQDSGRFHNANHLATVDNRDD